MKRLFWLSFLLSFPLLAQNFSPSAIGIGLQGTNTQIQTSPSGGALTNFTSPSTAQFSPTSPNGLLTAPNPPPTVPNTPSTVPSPPNIVPNTPNTTGPTNLDRLPLPLGTGTELLDQTNTAPTPIPEDTSLILTPEEEQIRQAQEAQINAIPPQNDTETTPGGITGGAVGGESGPVNPAIDGSDIITPETINGIP